MAETQGNIFRTLTRDIQQRILTNPPRGPPIDSQQYPVDTRYRGKALIFSHYFSFDVPEFHEAYKRDERRIKTELENLYFEVEVHQNKTVAQIQKILKQASKNEIYNVESACFAVVVLSHGDQTEVNGKVTYTILANDDEYDEEVLFENFDGKSCPSLAGKPKIFIIQTCRGTRDQTKTLLMDQKGHREGSEADKKKLYYCLPDNADFFIFRATSNGTRAFLNPQGTGSYFIKAICEELEDNRKNNYKHDFMTLMTFAIRRVATYMPNDEQERDPQQPFIMSTLMRLLYLTGRNSSQDEEEWVSRLDIKHTLLDIKSVLSIKIWMIIFAAILIIILLYAYIHLNEKSKQIDRMFPGPFRIPFLGTLLPFNIFQKNFDANNRWVQTDNHRPSRLWFFHKPYIVISDYKTAKIILSHLKYIDKTDNYKVLIPVMGKKHFLGTKELWAKYRKLTSSAFHHKALSYYLEIIDRNADILCSLLQKHIQKEAFDLTEYISMFVMDNLVESLSGESLHLQVNLDNFPWEAFRDLMQILCWRVLPIPGINWILNLMPLRRRQGKDLRLLEEFSEKLLQRKKERQSQNDESSNQDACILTKLIMTNEFSDEDILKEIQSTIVAAFESSSSTLCFMIYLLAKHQDIQEKIYKEVTTVVEESNSWPNLHDLDKMVYTEQVLYETLRRYTPFTTIGRYIKEDLPLNDHQFIPKNTNVFISLSGIHKDPDIWRNPNVFDPDRFSPENREKRDPYAFVPFSAGPKKCTGYKFAIVQIKLATAKIVQRFKLSLSTKPEDELRPVRTKGLVITSANGFNIKLQLRDEGKKL